jgi:hypothetical protein
MILEVMADITGLVDFQMADVDEDYYRALIDWRERK